MTRTGRRLLAVLLGLALPAVAAAGDRLPADLQPLEKAFKESAKPRKDAYLEAIRLHRAGEKEQARPILEGIVKDFGALKRDFTTYGALAGAYLDVHDADDLEIGKPAPEIAGVSPDGKPMKLSDYKGRVVVLDFFGDW